MSENRPNFDVFSAAGENFRPRGAPKLVFLLFFAFRTFKIVQKQSETQNFPPSAGSFPETERKTHPLYSGFFFKEPEIPIKCQMIGFNWPRKIKNFQPNFFVYKYFSVIPKDSEASHRVLHESFGITEKYL